MSACGGHFQGALDVLLVFDVGEIGQDAHRQLFRSDLHTQTDREIDGLILFKTRDNAVQRRKKQALSNLIS